LQPIGLNCIVGNKKDIKLKVAIAADIVAAARELTV
jgi:hypothetical protein